MRVGAWQDRAHHDPRPPQLVPSTASTVTSRLQAERPVGQRLHLRGDVIGLRVRGVRYRCSPAHRGLRASRSGHASFVPDALEQALHERRPVQAVSGASLGQRLARLGSTIHRAALAELASRRRSAASATTMTTPWRDDQRRVQGGGDPPAWPLALLRAVEYPPWSGSTGTTTDACSRRSATSLPPRRKRANHTHVGDQAPAARPKPITSDKPGAVQETDPVRRCSLATSTSASSSHIFASSMRWSSSQPAQSCDDPLG